MSSLSGGRDTSTGVDTFPINELPYPMLLVSADAQIMAANDAFFEVFPFSKEAVQGRSFLALFPGDDEAGVQRWFESTLHQSPLPPPIEIECAVPKLGRRTLRVEARSFPRGPRRELLLLLSDVTGERAGQKALQRERDELRDFMENASMALHQVGPDGTILWANQVELDFLGYRPEEYFGRHISEYHADQPVIDDILERLGRGEELHDYEARLRAKDGTIKHVLINSNVYWREGKFVHTRCFTRDMTERKRAENRLAAEHAVTRILAEAKDVHAAAARILQAIMGSVEAALAEFWIPETEQGSRLRCSLITRGAGQPADEFEVHAGRMSFTPGEGLPGRVWATRSPVWITELTEDDHFQRRDLAAKEGLRSALAFPLLDGETCVGVMAFYSRNRREPDDALLDMMATLGSEIGQFIQRRKTEAELRFEHDFRQGIEQCMASGMAACDIEGRQIYVNPAFSRMVGWSEEDLVGQLPPYRYWPPEEVESIQKAFRQTIEGQAPAEGFELHFQRRNGERFDVLVRVSALAGKSGTQTGWLASVTDISERKKAEEALRFLAAASELLSSSLDYEQTLNMLAHLAIHRVADWCTVDIVDGTNLKRLVVAHRDPSKVRIARRLQKEHPPDMNAQYGVAAVVRSGKSEYMSEIPEAVLESTAMDPAQRKLLRSLGLTSYICVPLFARGSILGALTLVSAESGRRYGEADLRLTEELARRAAIALDNAQLYESAQTEIAERSRVERALRESEEQLQRAMEAALMGAWQWDIQTSKVVWSRSLEKIHGRPPGSFGGTVESVMEDMDPRDVPEFQAAVRRAVEKREALHLEYRILYPDGTTRWLESHGTLELDAGGEPARMRGTCMDVTERKRAEEAARAVEASRALAAGLLRGQEEERRRLARELHDDFSQRVAAMSMETERLRRQAAASGADPLDKLQQQLTSLAEDIRRMSHDLHPPLLELLGLEEALQAECESVSAREKIAVEFTSQAVPGEIPRETALAVYRVAQESVRNICKHASTPRARVHLGASDSQLLLRIEDEGAGFDPRRVRAKGGLGLISMEERIRALGGAFEISSKLGAGTRIKVQVPLSIPTAPPRPSSPDMARQA